MSAEIKGAVQAIVTHTQVAAATSAATVTSGVVSYFGGLQGALSVVATCAGIVLSVILCITHWRKGVLERKLIKSQTETDALERKVLELEIAQLKQEVGK